MSGSAKKALKDLGDVNDEYKKASDNARNQVKNQTQESGKYHFRGVTEEEKEKIMEFLNNNEPIRSGKTGYEILYKMVKNSKMRKVSSSTSSRDLEDKLFVNLRFHTPTYLIVQSLKDIVNEEAVKKAVKEDKVALFDECKKFVAGKSTGTITLAALSCAYSIVIKILFLLYTEKKDKKTFQEVYDMYIGFILNGTYIFETSLIKGSLEKKNARITAEAFKKKLTTKFTDSIKNPGKMKARGLMFTNVALALAKSLMGSLLPVTDFTTNGKVDVGKLFKYYNENKEEARFYPSFDDDGSMLSEVPDIDKYLDKNYMNQDQIATEVAEMPEEEESNEEESAVEDGGEEAVVEEAAVEEVVFEEEPEKKKKSTKSSRK